MSQIYIMVGRMVRPLLVFERTWVGVERVLEHSNAHQEVLETTEGVYVIGARVTEKKTPRKGVTGRGVGGPRGHRVDVVGQNLGACL